MAEPIEAGVTHDIVIEVGGVQYGFMLDRRNPYGLQDSNRAIPNVPNTPLTLADYNVWTLDAQDSWLHGFGFRFARDNMGFDEAEGIETRLSGFIQLATKKVILKTHAEAQTFRAIEEFITTSDEYIVVAPSAGIDYFNGTVWTQEKDPDGDTYNEPVHDLLACDGYILLAMADASQGSPDRLYKFDGSSFTPAGSGTNPPNEYYRLERGGGYLWGSEHKKNLLHYDGSDDASQFEGGESDPNVIKVGVSQIPISGLCWWRDNLRVAKPDALYYIDRDFKARTEIPDFAKAMGPYGWYYIDGNFANLAAGPGGLWFTIPGKIYRWTGSSLVDMTPPTYGLDPPYNYWQAFRHFQRFNEQMYVIGEDSEFSNWLLCYANGSWHMIWKMAPEQPGYTVQAIGLSSYYGFLLFGLNEDDAGWKSRVYRIALHKSTQPYPSFDTGTYRYLYSPRYDFKSQVIEKSFWEFIAKVNNVNNTGRDVSIEYRIDDTGGWINLTTLIADGLHELLFSMPPPTGKWIQFRIGLRTDASGETPNVDTWGVRAIPRPKTAWAQRYNILIGDGVRRRDGKFDKRSPSESLGAIKAARDSETPVIVYDFWQGKHYGYVTYVAVGGVEFQDNMRTLPKKGGATGVAQIVFMPLRQG